MVALLALWVWAGCAGPASNLMGPNTGSSASLRGQSPDFTPAFAPSDGVTPPVGSPAGSPAAADVYAGEMTVASPTDPVDQSDAGLVVLGIKITGNQNVSESEIRRHLKTRKDRAYDPQTVQDDLRRLYSTRKFYNVRTTKQRVDSGIHITFHVLERPTIGEVLFIGNRYISDKRLLKETGLKKGDSLNIYTVQEARRKVEELYQSKGLTRTVVTVEEGEKNTDHRVVLRVDEGPVERIWKVRFIGNDPRLATDARLATQIKSKPGFLKYLFRGKLNHSQVDEDVERLTAYYRGLGYFRATVGRELVYDGAGQWVTVNFVINEGPRFKVRNVSVVGNEKLSEEQIVGQFDLQAGDFFNLDKMQRDENSLRDLYGSQGHIFADIKATPVFQEEPGQLDLVYRVDEGDLFRVGEIRIHVKGESPQTKRSVVLNRLSLRPGDIIDIRKVRASERRLKSSQLFVVNPAEGEPPRIVIRPPTPEETVEMAARREKVRGQSPDNQVGGQPVRDMVIDVFVPPFAQEQH
jgi:outer membrane protein insertion porin family